MIILKATQIENYRNIKNTTLTDLKDLNIFIGPNNCGKTNLLTAISNLSEISITKTCSYLCENCQKVMEAFNEVTNVHYPLDHKDKYLHKENNKVRITFGFDEGSINEMVPEAIQKLRNLLQRENNICYTEDIILSESTSGLSGLLCSHISIFAHKDILEEIKRQTLYCPEQRLQSYKEEEFKSYIRNKNLTGDQKRKWIDFLKKILDPKITDDRYENLIRKVNGEDFETTISEQGSGVRSLVCLAADILFENAKIVLIDEPELGLNPFVKQEFLKFLLTESKERQIFIATQDPTFLNPILWEKDNVAVYMYSPPDDEFVKVDLDHNEADYSIFSGFLPHTTSLKDIHIYVEGPSDVYIFHIWLGKYLKQKFPDDGDKVNIWKRKSIENRTAIYHLGGDFWEYLLYTVPKQPYKCVVILDGDKRGKAEDICAKYKESVINVSKFKFPHSLEKIKEIFKEKECHPVYCLKEDCIEKYLFSDFDCRQSPEGYDKKIDGSKKAEEMEDIPGEIKRLFEIIIGV